MVTTSCLQEKWACYTIWDNINAIEIDEKLLTFHENSLLFSKHFVPLHERMCLALVKIANFNSGSVRRRRLQFIPVDCTSVHIDGCLAIPNEV